MGIEKQIPTGAASAPKEETEKEKRARLDKEKLVRLFPDATNTVGYIDSRGVLQTAKSESVAGEKAQEEEREMA